MSDFAVSSLATILASSSAATVRSFHVNQAIDYYQKPSLYFAFAKEAAWDVDPPPIPDYDGVLEGVWGYKRIETRYLVVPDSENGTILYQNQKFRIVPLEDAKTEGARWMYCMSYINYDELPLKTYHQLGLVTGLIPKDTVPGGQYALVPDEVEDPGELEILNNRRGVGREADMREQISIIVEF